MDGYELMKKGQGPKALGASQICSFTGSMISTVFLSFFGVMLARAALKFSAPEYFALTLMGLMLVSSLTGKYPLKGYAMMLLGLIFGCVGLDNISGVSRFTFGNVFLVDGLKTVPILIGLLGFSECRDEKVYRQAPTKNFLVSKSSRLKS